MLYREIMAVCSEIHTKHINTAVWAERVFLGAFAKLPRSTIRFMSVRPSIRVSARPYETTRLQGDGFSWHLIFEFIPKICPESSSFIEIWQEQAALYVNTSVHLWKYPAEFFWEREKFQINVLRKSKYTFCVQELPPPPENSATYEIMS
jgi:hypothetical protein